MNLLDAFSWRSGTFQVSADLPPVDSPLKVRAPQLVLTGISKFAPEDEIAAENRSASRRKEALDQPATTFSPQGASSVEGPQGDRGARLRRENARRGWKRSRVSKKRAFYGLSMPSPSSASRCRRTGSCSTRPPIWILRPASRKSPTRPRRDPRAETPRPPLPPLCERPKKRRRGKISRRFVTRSWRPI